VVRQLFQQKTSERRLVVNVVTAMLRRININKALWVFKVLFLIARYLIRLCLPTREFLVLDSEWLTLSARWDVGSVSGLGQLLYQQASFSSVL
jgi:hypothetical protein